MKMIEVEIKARIKIKEIKEILDKLRAKFIKEEEQRDIYLSHPSRDFGKTDEALRVREIKDNYFLTYKGRKFDPQTKAREEIEVKTEKEIIELLKRLNFSIKGRVEKKRVLYEWNNLKICLDKVKGLGEFLEIEGNNLEDKKKMFKLLKKLNIERKNLIRKSYLEMQN